VERFEDGDGAPPGRRINHQARYEPSPCPDARRPRAAPAATRPRSPRPPSASARRSRSTSPAARLWRAGGLHSHEICPSSLQSEKRTQRPKLVAIAESPLRCDSAGPGSVLLRPRSARRLRRPCRCCYRPLLRPAIRRNLAVASDRHLTTSRGPRDEALRNNATPTEGSEGKVQARGSWPEYSGFEIPWSGRAPHGCVEAQLRNSLCFPLCPLCVSGAPGQAWSILLDERSQPCELLVRTCSRRSGVVGVIRSSKPPEAKA